VIEGPLEDTLVFLRLGSDRSRELMRRIFDLVDEAGRTGDRHHPAQSMLLEAATLLRQQIHSAVGVVGARGCLVNWQARKVRDYIDSHIEGPILVADLSVVAQLSEAHFSRAFKRTFGESPHAFVMRRRVELAARYMLTTDGSLSDIALRCGFTDHSHMCNQFRQAVGETPGAWRRARKWQHANTAQQAGGQAGISWRARVPLRLGERDEGIGQVHIDSGGRQ
jgi:AraC family transcriptional regulator